jgi:hypothetical protein
MINEHLMAVRLFNQKAPDIHAGLKEIMVEDLNERDTKIVMEQFSSNIDDNVKLEVLAEYKLMKDERGRFYISYW